MSIHALDARTRDIVTEIDARMPLYDIYSINRSTSAAEPAYVHGPESLPVKLTPRK
jgi:hypothetical protein